MGWETTSYLTTARKDGSLIIETTGAWGTEIERLVMADNGTMLVADKTWETDREAISVAIRMDEDKTYTDADLSGEY